jgi:outer membrane protein insertion porin family/translocation and assembly module TamA
VPTPQLRATSSGTCAALLLLLGSACATIPSRRFATESISVSGNSAIDDADILEHIATRETPRFLGVFQGVMFDYEVFDRYVLERDLQRVERYYRSRGYYRTHVRAGRVTLSGSRKVSVEILVEEGPPTRVGRIDVHGTEGLDPGLVEDAESDVMSALGVGDIFEEENFDIASADLQRLFADSGHAYVRVKRAADVDVTRNLVSLGYWVEAGPIVRLGAIDIKGLDGIPEDQIRRTLRLEPGDLYSISELESAERALLDLGVFSAVSVKPDLEQRPEAKTSRVAIHVEVEKSKFRSVHLGGGLQVDSQRTDVHLVAGWEDRNFFGGLRNFLVEFVPGAVIYPTRLPDLESPEQLLPQARLRLELRQPNFIEAITSGVIRAQSSLYPVLLSSERDPDAPILGYRDLRASAGLERSIYWKLFGSLTHNVQLNDPFTYKGELDPDLDTAIVSYPELFLRLDARDDRLAPKKGGYASTTLQFAGVGGDARDVRLQPEGRVYLPLGGRYNLAIRGSFGLLFAQNYGDTIATNAYTGSLGASRADAVRDIQLMYLRGFFAGGPGSNRGYALREIGPHGAVPFYNPGQSSEEFSGTCDPAMLMGEDLPTNCNLPLGGFTLWEASAELRFPLFGDLRGALFLDGADASPYELDFRFNRPHLSAGIGFRYATPIGPVRLDIGYRLPGLQHPDDSGDEYDPNEILGLPIALSFGIGEPF